MRRGITGQGAHGETSLLEALVDFPFEVLTTHLNDGRRLPKRSAVRSAHAYLSAPYGVYAARDAIKALIADTVASRTVDDGLAVLEPADIWGARLLNRAAMLASDGFRALDMLQTVTRNDGVSILTTRSPLRINGARPASGHAAPQIGAQSAALRAEFGL